MYEIAEFLKLPETFLPVTTLVVGYPDENPKKSSLNNPVSPIWRGFGAEMVLWELQRPSVMLRFSWNQGDGWREWLSVKCHWP